LKADELPNFLFIDAQRTTIPGFPVELVGVGEFHAAFLNESRTRGPIQRSVQEIRVWPAP
jgi:hypothetical protein